MRAARGISVRRSMDIRPGPGLRIILLEDDPQDAELLIAALERSYPGSEVLRVDRSLAFRRALEARRPDVILSGYGVGALSALDALRLAHSEESVVDEDAGELIADRAMDEQSDDG